MIPRLGRRPRLLAAAPAGPAPAGPAQAAEPALATGPASRLDGTVSVITGGGRGIGRVLARALAEAGAAVGVIARSGTELAETVRLVEASGGTAAAASADVTDQRAVAAAVDALGRRLGLVDLLVNNAGVGGPVGDAWLATGRRAQPAEHAADVGLCLGRSGRSQHGA